MKTTALIAEVLVVGVLGLVWLALAVALLPGPRAEIETVRFLLSEHVVLAGVVLAALAYAMGVVIDRVADVVLRRWDDKHGAREQFHRGDVDPSLARIAVANHGGAGVEFLNYQRSRIRVARASVMNFALITLMVVVHLVGSETVRIVVGITTILLFPVGGALCAWRSISGAYYRRLSDAYNLSTEAQDAVARAMKKKVAKVLVRAGDSYLFSIKRAAGKKRDGRLELFGGTLEADEEPFAALLRELEEEEKTGLLAREVRRQRPRPESVLLRHKGSIECQYVYALEIALGDAESLEADDNESHGLEWIPAANFTSDKKLRAMRDRFTPKSIAIFRGMGRKI